MTHHCFISYSTAAVLEFAHDGNDGLLLDCHHLISQTQNQSSRTKINSACGKVSPKDQNLGSKMP